MTKDYFLKKYLPYVVAIVLFAVLSCIYCAPVFEGKELYAGDNVRFKEAVHEVSKYHEETGKYSFWTGSMFAGMPAYQIGVHYDSDDFLRPVNRLLRPSHNKHVQLVLMLYFCCFFVLLRSVGIDRWLAIVGALATGFSSYFFIIEPAGHHTKAWSIALMAVVAAGFFFIFKKKYGLGASLTMIFTAAGLSPHPQMAYYVFMMIGVVYVAELYIHIKEKRYKDLAIATAIFAVSVLIGIGTGSAGVFANSEYVKETMRGGHSDIVTDDTSNNSSNGLSLDYMTQWSYGIDESLTFMIPGFMGNASGYDVGTNSVLYKQLTAKGVSRSQAKDFCQQAPAYWGEQPFTAGPVYAGAAVCFLFILGLLLVKGPYKWAILVATFFSFALSWGKNWMWLTEFFYNWFPMYGKFRSVSSILIVAEMTVPLLGFMAIKQIMDGNVKREELNRSIYVSAGITGGLCLIFALFGGSLFSFVSSNDASLQSQLPDWAFAAIIAERASILRSDSFRSFVFILLSAGVIWLFANDKLKKQWMIAALGIIVVADMWPVDKRFFNESNFVYPKQFNSSFATLPYEQAIMTDTDPHFRVLNIAANTFNDSRTSYNLKSLGGYSAAKLRRYQDIIDQYLSKVDINVASMLNAKYIITQGEDGRPTPMRNPGALGNAWYVSSLVKAPTPNEECYSIGSVDLASTIVVGEDFKQYVANFKPAAEGSYIQLSSYAPDVLTYKSNSQSDGTVVFSEIFYPYGWKGYIDGKPAEIFRANYLLRAMNIPAGQHDIRMEFRPDSVRKGTTISIICIMIMYATVLGAIAVPLVKRGRQRKSA